MTTPRQQLAAAAAQSQMSNYLKDYFGLINVKSYGAKGDGIINDTYAILAAKTAAASAGSKSLFFPHGTYLINAGTSFTGFFLWGDNSIFSGISDTINQAGDFASAGGLAALLADYNLTKADYNSYKADNAKVYINMAASMAPFVDLTEGGLVDCSAAIQARQTYAESLTNKNVVLLFPAGKYLINTKITIHHGNDAIRAHWIGHDTRLIAGTVGMTMLEIVRTLPDEYYNIGKTVIDGIYIDGASKAAIGIDLQDLNGFYKSLLSNVDVYNCTIGINIHNCRMWSINDCSIYSPDVANSIGINFTADEDMFCGDCWISKTQIVTHATSGKGISGVCTKNSTGSTLNGVHIDHCVIYGNGVTLTASDVLSSFRDWWIDGCAFDSRNSTNGCMQFNGFLNGGSGAIQMSDIWLNGFNTGIYIVNCDGVTIKGGKLSSLLLYGVYVEGGKENSVESLKCYDCNKNNNGSGVISLQGAGYRNKVVANNIYNVGENTLAIIYVGANQIKPIVTLNTTDAGTCVFSMISGGTEGVDFILAGNLS
jgi:hypothetical protein